MSDYSTSQDAEQERTRRRSGAPVGLDPVSSARLGEIIDAEPVERGRPRQQLSAPEGRRPDQFTRATWVMIVIAGVVLGVAMAMIAAG
jgi:hypothetical protein